jgi:Xaa-Pro aminopeptidase
MRMLPLLLAVTQQGAPPATTYPVFEDDKLPPAVYRERRERVKQLLGPNGVALLLTNPTRNRSNDTDFRFRPDSDFWYLTGMEEPDAALLLAPGGIDLDGKRVTEVLFVNVSDPMSETWLGYRMGPSNAERLLGVQAARPNGQFGAVLAKLKPTDWTANMPADASGTVQKMAASFGTWRAAGAARPVLNLNREIGKMRVKKSPGEIALLRKAIDASVLAHAEAMRSVEPGMREHQLQAVVEYVFTRQGCEFTAYNSIVGSGPNSCILHYEANRRKMAAGEIICMDVGGEYHGYAADVTRSFPVGGKFSPAQRAVYDVVLAAQDAGIAACRPGASFGDPHRAAEKVMAEGLVRLGIIKEPRELGRYFMHGTSHYIGLDVHDSHGDNTLRDGYTLTVEPGIYIKAGSPCDPKWWNIGIRIEDDILVTEKGPVNLSGALPRQAAAIEALMREKGIGNVGVKGVSRS